MRANRAQPTAQGTGDTVSLRPGHACPAAPPAGVRGGVRGGVSPELLEAAGVPGAGLSASGTSSPLSPSCSSLLLPHLTSFSKVQGDMRDSVSSRDQQNDSHTPDQREKPQWARGRARRWPLTTCPHSACTRHGPPRVRAPAPASPKCHPQGPAPSPLSLRPPAPTTRRTGPCRGPAPSTSGCRGGSHLPFCATEAGRAR